MAKLTRPTALQILDMEKQDQLTQDALYLAVHGIRVSKHVNLGSTDPVNDAIREARPLKLPVVLDVDTSTTMPVVLMNGDKLISLGANKLTKLTNTIPNIPPAQHPDRPSGVMSNFNVDSAIIFQHGNNASAQFIRVQGFQIITTEKNQYSMYAPSISYSTIDNLWCSGFLRGFKFQNAYMMSIKDVKHVYYYSDTDTYSENYCYDISDGTYTAGTSVTMERVYCTNYKKCFYFRELNYSTFTNCGGEGVGSHNNPTPTDMPRVFEFFNCPSIVLNTPSSENLYGSFLRFTSDNTGSTRGACTLVVNGIQLNTGQLGTAADVGAKIIDIDGTASCIINGGVLVGAASGKFLKLGGANGSSYLEFNGTDLRFAKAQIAADTQVYGGVTSVKGQQAVTTILGGMRATSTNVVAWNTAVYDDFSLRTNQDYIKLPFTGWYEIDVMVPVNGVSSGATVALCQSSTATDTGSVVQMTYLPVSASNIGAIVKYKAKIAAGQHMYVRVTGCTTVAETSNLGAQFSVRLL